MLPTSKPSALPTSVIPSAVPTITGDVASISLSGIVTADMPFEDINAISSNLAEIYGVDSSDVETTVDYVASGTLDVTIPDDVSEEVAINALQESISNVLGVHSSDVVVTIDEDGEVSYSITGATYKEIEEIQSIASTSEFASEITSKLDEGDSGVVVDSANSIDDIEIVVSATVDTTKAILTSDPIAEIDALVEEYGLTDSNVKGTF